MNEVLVKVLHYGDDRRPQGDEEERGKDEEDKRKDKLDGCLGCLLLDLLTTLGSEGVRMNSQSLGDAGAEFFRLNEHGDEIADALDVGAIGKVLPRIGSGQSGSLFQHDDAEFVADGRLRHLQFLGGARGGLIET